MNLGFKRHFKDGTPTLFVEKIWTGWPVAFVDGIHDDIQSNYEKVYYEKFGYPDKPLMPYQKIHSIRLDRANRWKIGNKIHFVVGLRTKDRFQFAPILKVKTIQKIEIKHYTGIIQVKIDDKLSEVYHHGALDSIYEINGFLNLDKHEPESCFWKNDGFDSIEQFFEWFSEDFTGKLIHWTDKTY